MFAVLIGAHGESNLFRNMLNIMKNIINFGSEINFVWLQYRERIAISLVHSVWWDGKLNLISVRLKKSHKKAT